MKVREKELENDNNFEDKKETKKDKEREKMSKKEYCEK